MKKWGFSRYFQIPHLVTETLTYFDKTLTRLDLDSEFKTNYQVFSCIKIYKFAL